MYVVACIKQVPDTTLVQIDPFTDTLVSDGSPCIINPCDSNALEESVRIKERYGLKVAALSMGPANAETMLRKALARGADQAVLVCDRAFGGADTLATSCVLAAALRKLSQDEQVGLVFCGTQTIDGFSAQVGPGLAVRLGFSQLTLVDRIEELDLQAGKIRVRRRLEGGYEVAQAKLPALVTVVPGLNRPRYPTVPMRLWAEEEEIRVWDNGHLKLDVDSIGLLGSPTRVSRIYAPQRSQGEVLGDGVQEPSRSARLLVERLLARDLLAL